MKLNLKQVKLNLQQFFILMSIELIFIHQLALILSLLSLGATWVYTYGANGAQWTNTQTIVVSIFVNKISVNYTQRIHCYRPIFYLNLFFKIFCNVMYYSRSVCELCLGGSEPSSRASTGCPARPLRADQSLPR